MICRHILREWIEHTRATGELRYFVVAQKSLVNQVSPTGLRHVKLSTTNTNPGL